MYKEIWDTLSKIDVNKHTEKKGNLTYLSWAWAWGVLMEHYPDASFAFADDEWCEHTNTVMVSCVVNIKGCTRSMWLPVMDYKNNAVEKPTARMVSDTRMRCLVKCLALYGLGFYIYAGEDIPTAPNAARVVPKVDAPNVDRLNTFKSLLLATAKGEGIAAAREIFAKAEYKDLREWMTHHEAEWLQKDLKNAARKD